MIAPDIAHSNNNPANNNPANNNPANNNPANNNPANNNPANNNPANNNPAARHVLIVDDEVDAAYPLNRALSLKGLRVTHAVDGNQGLAIIENDPPDLVLLDIMLPGRSGLLLLEAIRERTDFSAPIVMVSGIDADRHRNYALTLGATDYVTKPYAMSRMLKLVEQLLSPQQDLPGNAG